MQPDRHIVRVADAGALAVAAAERLIAGIAENKNRVAVCLTGGSSPKRLYELLATEPYDGRIPWARVHWFVGDERFVPPDNPNSNIAMARGAFLDICAPPATVHPIVTDTTDPDVAARDYENTLREFYGADTLDPARPLFDCVLMGLGPDGHTASIFPDYAALDERERWVVGVPRAPVAPFVERVTLTLPALASSREMLFLVSGEEKRDVVSKVFAHPELPAARSRSKGETVWLIDDAAYPSALK